LVSFAERAACSIRFASLGVNRTAINTPFAFCVPSLGLPRLFFIINVIQLTCIHIKSV
jgi:hypothetical protein